MSMQTKQISEFIEKRIRQVRQQGEQASDAMYKLKYAITEVAFAQTLSQYLQNSQYLYIALLHLAQAYILNQSYCEAITHARFAKKQATRTENGKQDQTILLIVECMAKQDKHEDAEQVISQINLQGKDQHFRIKYYQLLLSIQVKLNKEDKAMDTSDKLQTTIVEKHGKRAQEYGFFLVEKGRSVGNFQKWKDAINYLNQGIEILIQTKCKQKKRIMAIYLTLADYHKKLAHLEKQYSSLICAHSMAKQLNEQTAVLPIIHLIATNLIERQEYQKALKELKSAKEIEKQCFGESSSQIAKTVKKITQILSKLNLKSEMKKYEQQYSRIIGPSRVIFKQKANI